MKKRRYLIRKTQKDKQKINVKREREREWGSEKAHELIKKKKSQIARAKGRITSMIEKSQKDVNDEADE